MNTRTLMSSSSLVLGAAGLAASFAPAEVLAALDAPAARALPVFMQLLGALYLAFAMANWIAKDSLIGGIYARPLAIGNCIHFVIGALALLKFELANGIQAPLAAAAVVYLMFALAFGYLVFGRSPARERH